MNKLGRPCGDGRKSEQFILRMTKSDMEKLRYTSRILDMSKSEVLRKGLAVQYNLAKLRDEKH